MAVYWGKVSDRFFKGRDRQKQRRRDSLDELIKRKQLEESGYNVQERPSIFGRTYTAERDPGYVSMAQLQRQNLQKQIADYESPDEKRRKAMETFKQQQQVKADMENKAYDDGELSYGQQIAKDKATNAIYETVETNKVRRESLKEAREFFDEIPQGYIGRKRLDYAMRHNPSNPMLYKWQKIKRILTDAQLMNTAKTKGAISDREMALFAEAAANDDFFSIARSKATFDALEKLMDAEENSLVGAYQRNYGEDPRTWFGDNGGSAFGTEMTPRQKAIKYLQDKGELTDEENIQYIMSQMEREV